MRIDLDARQRYHIDPAAGLRACARSPRSAVAPRFDARTEPRVPRILRADAKASFAGLTACSQESVKVPLRCPSRPSASTAIR
jgi:hypothetical protein